MLYMLYNMIYNVVPQKTAPTAFKKDSAAPTLSGEAFREETTARNNRWPPHPKAIANKLRALINCRGILGITNMQQEEFFWAQFKVGYQNGRHHFVLLMFSADHTSLLPFSLSGVY